MFYVILICLNCVTFTVCGIGAVTYATQQKPWLVMILTALSILNLVCAIYNGSKIKKMIHD